MTRAEADSLAAFIERHDPRYRKAQVVSIFQRGAGTTVQVMVTHVNGQIADYWETEIYVTEARANVEDSAFQETLRTFAEGPQKGRE